MNSNTEIFLEKYREVEYCIRNKYHLDHWESAVAYLEKHAEFRQVSNELKFCREVRNLLSHKPKIKEEYCVTPSDEMIDLIDHVKEILEKPPVIMDIAMPAQRLLYKSYNDNVVESLKEMNDRSFGNVPILEKGVVVGVLSEKGIVNYIVKENKFRISDQLKLADIKEHLALERHSKELYQFVRKDALISDVSDIFHNALRKGARVGMIFITQNGKPEERLLGIATAWDLAGRK